jgi:energy-coupling factor transporter ATP-binding protein EcfA2
MLVTMTIDLPQPSLLGVRVQALGPISDAFLRLREGMTVLYGRNGAGKTHLLRAVESLWQTPLDVPARQRRQVELVYEWPLPEWLSAGRWSSEGHGQPGDQGDLLSQPEVRRWKSLPGNPWFAVSPALDYSVNDQEYMDNVLPELAELLHRVLPESGGASEPGRRLARQIAVDLNIEQCDDEGATRVAAVCDEIVRRARFSYSGGTSWPVVVHDSDSPLLQRMVKEIRDGTSDDEYIIDGSENLGLGYAGHLVPHHTWEREAGGTTDGAVAITPAWYGDRWRELRPTLPPAQLVAESRVDIHERTIRALEDRLSLTSPHDHAHDGQGSLLVEHSDGSVTLQPELASTIDAMAADATRFARLLLEGAPELRCEISSAAEWYRLPPFRWVALDPTGIWVELEVLSRAQRRWAELSIALALDARTGVPLVIVIDEPEAALHRRAERHLVRGLDQLSRELNACVVVATHSPAFFEQTNANLVHVYREPGGHTSLSEMPPLLRDGVDDLGLHPSDLLQLCRTVVLVEGQHELAIFDELLGDELRQVGALMFAMRGVTKLGSAADAQLLFTYTDATLLVVVDNDHSERVNDIWDRACRAADDGSDPLQVLAEFTRHKRDYEQIALQEFCALAVSGGTRERIRFRALSLPDVPEYLPVHAVAPGAPAAASWATLHAAHERTGKPGKRQRFKNWMADTHDADYSDESLRAAARSMDSIPADFIAILRAAEAGR